MIELHSFLNSDSPGIVAVWSEQPLLRGRVEKLTTTSLEQHILSKPYFDPNGLIVAHEEGRVVGFVHAGFAPSAQPGQLNLQSGIISQLMVSSRADAPAIAGQLLLEGESWLRKLGAKELIGGGSGMHAPFYLGLYGGCRLPGVLVGDMLMTEALRTAGYLDYRESTIWQRTLATFRPPVDRELMTLRRQYRLQSLGEETVNDWSEACAYSWIDRQRFGFDTIANGVRSASLTFWNMEPLASGWGQRTMGLSEVTMHDDAPSTGLLTCFIAEAIRQFQSEGVNLVEIQTDISEVSLSDTCQKLGFGKVDCGIQFRKSVDNPAA